MMRKIVLFFVLGLLMRAVSLEAQNVKEAVIEKDIQNLLSQMTLEEKVGQMTQITLSVVYPKGEKDKEKLKDIVVDHNVGSMLNTIGGSFSVEEWHDLLTEIQKLARKTRLKIPVLYGIDAIHGVTYTKNSTLFPHNIAMGATRNPELVHQAGKITALECRASGLLWNFDPVLGLGRQPLWPRFEETFGEDLVLTTVLGNELIKAYEEDGLEKNSSVASCMKHYLGYSVPRSGKDRTPAFISDIELRELFLPPFEAAVKNGSSTVMVNSGSINGIPVHMNKYLITEVLKKELGFDGLVVTDWEDIVFLTKAHHVAGTNKEAVMLAVNAGIDMSMVPFDFSFYDDLIELVKEGKVSMERIDDAVTRILRLKYRLGLFENPFPDKDAVANFGRPEYKNVALDAARECMTLLKNDTLANGPVLPLEKGKKILLAGPAANNLPCLHGSWSRTWSGQDLKEYPENTQTIYEVLVALNGKKNVICNSGKEFMDPINYSPHYIREMAPKVDYVVLCLGENSYAETPGNIDDLALPKEQIELVMAAVESGKPIILVLAEGRPRILNEIEPVVDGILLAYRPGEEGSQAIAEVLMGEVNPSGKLPFSYPRSSGNLQTYDCSNRAYPYYNPQWPFGFGLSYTTFEYKKLDVAEKGEGWTVDVTVKNTGNREGKTTVELYVRDLFASVIPANKRLKKFQKILLKPGEERVVSFHLTREDLSMINAQLERVTEPGEFIIMTGPSSLDQNMLKQKIKLK